MKPSQLGLVVGNMVPGTGQRMEPRPLSMPFVHRWRHVTAAFAKAIADGASCRLWRAALIWARAGLSLGVRSRLILPGSGGMGRHDSIDRVGTDDVMSLVSDRQDPPLQVGVIPLLDVRKGLDPVQLKEALKHRLAAVPRLRKG